MEKWRPYRFPCHQLHQLEVHMQTELTFSGCFDLTLGSREWVCRNLLVEKTNSSGLHRGTSSSTRWSPRDATACSLAFLWSFFSQTEAVTPVWGGVPPCGKVSAPWEGAVRGQLPTARPSDCPTRCLAPRCCLLWLRLWKKVYFSLRYFCALPFFLFCFCLTAMTASPHYYGKYRVGGNYYLSMNGSRSGHSLHWPFFDKV